MWVMSIYVSDILSLIFGNLSIVINIAITFPQLISIAKTKNTSGTSLSSYILFVATGITWLIWALVSYGVNVSHIDPEAEKFIVLHIASLVPTILCNLIIAVLASCILFYKVKYLRGAKKHKMTELQYSQLVFDNHKKDTWIQRYRPLFIIGAGVILLCGVIILLLFLLGLPEQITQAEYDKLSIVVLVLNTIAAVFNESVSWPQFIKCMKTKDTSGISMGWAIFLPTSCTVCLAYDAFLATSFGWKNVLASLICNGVIINVLVLIVKLKNHFAAKKLGISEWKYTKKYIATKAKNK